MLKRFAALFLIVLALGLQGCISSAGGLQAYNDSYEGYEFLYPMGWVPVEIDNGPDAVFHDIINPSENVSVIISPVSEGKTLQDLGTPTEVGYKLSKSITSLTDDDRNVELVNAQSFSVEDKLYYVLEYIADVPSGIRHNLASVIVRRGQLYTFNASVPESRWDKMKNLVKQSVASFSVY
ncbi:photosystem II reaction center PsbP family protein [Romeria aff. gracilis LEGE 07310]|uniref:Photosystem II reaction center PsbP family protein n=1 Tax=Vasconcelosia minhoensis LEGE 07310 TaxID=915328 RepID=A0A8J7ANZ0_9CYAN|nr:photosystem II reaction center PsbP [Romeria gracilis]MBE9078600.1 photosystem II reaction center PsbP family protein [Romeria aff. gracilis LEGE 07310]